jgi:hypothetical protein
MPPTYVIIGCYLAYALYRHFCVDLPNKRRQKQILAGQSRCAEDVVDMRERIVWLEDNPSNRMWKRKTG